MKIILNQSGCSTDTKFSLEIENADPTDQYTWTIDVDDIHNQYYGFIDNGGLWGSQTYESNGTAQIRVGKEGDLASSSTTQFINKKIVITASSANTLETTTSSFLFPFDFPIRWPTILAAGVGIGGEAYEKNKVIRVNITLTSPDGTSSRKEHPYLKAYDEGGYGLNDQKALWAISPSDNVIILSESSTYVELVCTETGYLNFQYNYEPVGNTCHGAYDLNANNYIGIGNPSLPTYLVAGEITGDTSGVCNGVPTKYVANATGTVAESTKRYAWSSVTDPDAIFDQTSVTSPEVDVTFSKSGASGTQNLQCVITSTDPDCINSVINTTYVAVEDCAPPAPPAPILSTLFIIQRGDEQFSCKGSELEDKLQGVDRIAIQRGDTLYGYVITTDNTNKIDISTIRDTDLLACTDTNGTTYTVTGAQFKELFGPSGLRLVSDVEWRFDASNSIVITKDAVAADGVEPYTLKTEFDIEISEETVVEDLPRVPINAQPMPNSEKIVIAFGVVTPAGSADPQELYQYAAADGTWDVLADPQSDPNLLPSVCNRYGCSSISHGDHQIIIDHYGASGTDASNSFFVMHNGTKTKVLPPGGSGFYKHLDPSSVSITKPVSRFFMRRGELYAAVYASGVVRYPNMTYDEDGFPNLQDPAVATGEYVPSVGKVVTGHYMKGAVYDPISDRLYYSHERKFIVFDFRNWPDNTTVGEEKPLVTEKSVATDNSLSVNIAFTSSYAVRTIINSDGARGACQVIDNLDYLPGGGAITDIYSSLLINNLDQTKLFKLKPGDPVKYMNYDSTASPHLESSWTEYRPEPIANDGFIGGAGAIIEEPFLLAWYQNGGMRAWGSIPKAGTDATVKQTITDSREPTPDSVVSEVSQQVTAPPPSLAIQTEGFIDISPDYNSDFLTPYGHEIFYTPAVTSGGASPVTSSIYDTTFTIYNGLTVRPLYNISDAQAINLTQTDVDQQNTSPFTLDSINEYVEFEIWLGENSPAAILKNGSQYFVPYDDPQSERLGFGVELYSANCTYSFNDSGTRALSGKTTMVRLGSEDHKEFKFKLLSGGPLEIRCVRVLASVNGNSYQFYSTNQYSSSAIAKVLDKVPSQIVGSANKVDMNATGLIWRHEVDEVITDANGVEITQDTKYRRQSVDREYWGQLIGHQKGFYAAAPTIAGTFSPTGDELDYTAEGSLESGTGV